MRRYLMLLCLLAAVLLAGCGTHTTTVTRTTTIAAGASSQPVYSTPYGPSAHSPTFGLAPKTLGLTPPAHASAPTVEMFDTVTLSSVPANPSVLAGYTAGHWPTYLPLVRAYPHAVVKSIAIGWSYRAQCMDIEPGDATPSEAGPWVKADIAAGFPKPCLYANLSTMPQVKANLAATLGSSWRSKEWLWDADWTSCPHLDAGYDATQCTDHALNRNLDESTDTLAFAGLTPAPPNLRHDERLDATPRTFTNRRGHVVARASERRTYIAWTNARCVNPVRREVCKSSRYHLALLRGRLVYVSTHNVKTGRVLEHSTWGQGKPWPRGDRNQVLYHELGARTPYASWAAALKG